ncbi:MAG: EscU/YscU/HrcU family type III secretion system export apparatus switch protein, partial [Butyrivibrio sp.]
MIKYDLQFFAKDGPGGEKTEPATAKKLKEAREKGQVAKSHDLSGSVILLALFITLKIYIGTLGGNLIENFGKYYRRIADLSGTDIQLDSLDTFFNSIFDSALYDILILLIPLLLVGFVVAFAVDVVQVKWKPTSKTLKPKFDKFNPINGIKRMFSVRTLVQLLKSIVI